MGKSCEIIKGDKNHTICPHKPNHIKVPKKKRPRYGSKRSWKLKVDVEKVVQTLQKRATSNSSASMDGLEQPQSVEIVRELRSHVRRKENVIKTILERRIILHLDINLWFWIQFVRVFKYVYHVNGSGYFESLWYWYESNHIHNHGVPKDAVL